MLRDTLRVYDQSILTWLSNFEIRGNKLSAQNQGPNGLLPTLTFASPERPFGEPPVAEQMNVVEQLASPRVSVQRLDVVHDPLRSNYFEWLPVLDTIDGKNYIAAKQPVPCRIPYQIDFMSRYRADGNQFVNALMLTLDTVKPVVLTLDFGFPWHKQRLHLFLDGGVVDNSDLETEENERWIRHTANVTVDAWLFVMLDGVKDVPDYLGVTKKVPMVLSVQAALYFSDSLAQRTTAAPLADPTPVAADLMQTVTVTTTSKPPLYTEG